MTVMDGVPDKKLVAVDHQLRKRSQVFEEKELDKHSAVRSCQAGGSGEGEWSRQLALHEACFGVQVLPWPKKTATTIMHKIKTLFLSWDIKKSSLIALRCAAMRGVAASRATVPIS